MAVKKEDVLAYLESANMMEVSELISDIEEKFGVSAAAPVAVVAAPAGDAGGTDSKSEFDSESRGSRRLMLSKQLELSQTWSQRS